MNEEFVKELAEAVVDNERVDGASFGPDYCAYCGEWEKSPHWEIPHKPDCIFIRAKAFLKEIGE